MSEDKPAYAGEPVCDCSTSVMRFNNAYRHAFDCPAHFNATNRKLAGIAPGYDPYNHVGKFF